MKHNWEYKKLGEIAYFESGSRPSGGVRGINNGVLSLGGEHIDINGYLNLTSPKYVSKHYFESNLKGHIKDGDILLCKDGALTGKVALVRNELNGIDAMINEHVFILRTNMLFQPYLFKYLFSKVGQQELKSRITGAAQGGLNRNNLSTTLIPLPPLSVQERIVEELDRLSLILEKKKQQIKELDSLAQSIFYDMFGDPIENEKGWEMKPISEIARFYNGKAHEQAIDEKGEYVLVNSKFISSNGMIKKRTNLQLCPLFINDITMVMSDVPNGKALAKCYLIDKDNIYTLNQRICVFRGYQILPQYLLFALNRNKYFLNFNDGNGQTNLRKNEVEKCPIQMPPLDLQQSFAKKIEAIEKQKELINQSIKEVQLLFDAKMDYYFGD